jgi:hypothetical protein
MNTLSKQDKHIIINAEDELNRKRQFNRIYPASDSMKYKAFFN